MTARSLLDLFRPPAGLVGQSGLISAFCATADFLDHAVATFSRLSRRRRENLGQPFLFLLLDAHKRSDRTRTFQPNEVPGVVELPPLTIGKQDLLHAKVGLLAFGRSRAAPPTLLRLIVTTGNWTQTSARRQLELAWELEVRIEDGRPEGPWNDRADLVEASAFFIRVLERFAVAPRLRETMSTLLELAKTNPPARQTKRFIHTLEPSEERSGAGTSIYEHLAAKAPADRDRPRDLVICGAGFFEKPGRKGAKPEVLDRLDKLPGLRAGTRFAVVRPTDAGALAGWKSREDGWTLVGAVDSVAEGRASSAARSLHAKFVYVGRKWGRSVRDGWLYLGSGNLTKRGFLLRSGTAARGNVEAGVIIDLPGTMNANELAAQLFIDLDADPLMASEITSGHDDEDDFLAEPLVASPPVLLAEEFIDDAGQRSLRLSWNEEDASNEVTLAWPGAEVTVERGRTSIALPPGPCPSVLTIRAGGQEMLVPVMDASGRLCRVPLVRSRFDDVLADILNFPAPPADDEQDTEDDASRGPSDGVATPPGPSDHEEEITYPLQEMMDLLEKIAALQHSLPSEHLPDWFEHLETRLVECFSERQITRWRAFEFPVLATLLRPGFCPPEMTPEHSERYVRLIGTVSRAWSIR